MHASKKVMAEWCPNEGQMFIFTKKPVRFAEFIEA